MTNLNCYQGDFFTFQQIRALIKSEKMPGKQDPYDAFVFVIMSHGCCNEYIRTVDGYHLHINRDIAYEFDGEYCPGLRGKPKIFIVQACRAVPCEFVCWY